jgi:ABC-2 type transport system permease protein
MSTWEIGASLAILTGSIALAMWIAAKVFRVFLLMYGKTPGLKEIVKYVREA